MIKLLIIVILGFLGFIIFNKITNSIKQGKKTPLNNNNNQMIACTKCGTHIPKDDIIYHNNKPYCCNNHIPK